MEEEIWKSIIGYEGIYEISSLGNVKSLKFNKEKFLRPGTNKGGYKTVVLAGVIPKTRTVHQLVAEAFLGFNQCGHKYVVNHKDFNKLNNCKRNLEIVSQRENANKKHLQSTSKYTGVYWRKDTNKWQAEITIKYKKTSLGSFKNEYDAHLAYQKELTKLIKT